MVIGNRWCGHFRLTFIRITYSAWYKATVHSAIVFGDASLGSNNVLGDSAVAQITAETVSCYHRIGFKFKCEKYASSHSIRHRTENRNKKQSKPIHRGIETKNQIASVSVEIHDATDGGIHLWICHHLWTGKWRFLHLILAVLVDLIKYFFTRFVVGNGLCSRLIHGSRVAIPLVPGRLPDWPVHVTDTWNIGADSVGVVVDHRSIHKCAVFHIRSDVFPFDKHLDNICAYILGWSRGRSVICAHILAIGKTIAAVASGVWPGHVNHCRIDRCRVGRCDFDTDT